MSTTKEDPVNYRILNNGHIERIEADKLLQLEAEHARLSLDLRLARATGVQNENVAAADQQLALLVEQIATLTSWITPAPPEGAVEGELVDAATNGQS